MRWIREGSFYLFIIIIIIIFLRIKWTRESSFIYLFSSLNPLTCQGLKVLGGLGFSGTLNVITSKAGDGMALLTMDDDYQSERDNEHKVGWERVGEGSWPSLAC
jgi:hypothetical protein